MKLIEKKKAERQNQKSDSVGDMAANIMDQSRGVDEKYDYFSLKPCMILKSKIEK